MATYRHWSVSLWRDPDDVSHCWILSPDKTEWRLISATLCRWRRCFVADQLWFMTRIREEEEEVGCRARFCWALLHNCSWECKNVCLLVVHVVYCVFIEAPTEYGNAQSDVITGPVRLTRCFWRSLFDVIESAQCQAHCFNDILKKIVANFVLHWHCEQVESSTVIGEELRMF